ncbi:MAG: hypothetical protein R3Y38_00285 [Rikenellaceae bacterium]
MKKHLLLIFTLLLSISLAAQTSEEYQALLKRVEQLEAQSKVKQDSTIATPKKSRLTIGGYGEITMSYHNYSSAWQRYTKPDTYADASGYGRFDIPRLVLMLGYDFGKGWSFGTEIEFEHGGTGAVVEIEEEETGEYETEVESGGEVVLEQFWINKRWADLLNLKMGHIIVPVGATNQSHLPVEYFGVSRPEGDTQILPTTWHETGISLWGQNEEWYYELQFIAGLDADRFSPENWVGGSAGSIYEFKIANSYAGAFRLNNSSINNLTLGLSGYYGNSASNTLQSYSYNNLEGTVMIGAFDFNYSPKAFIARGGIIYGTLSDSYAIATGNAGAANAAPTSGKNSIGSAAISLGVEAGYDIFSLSKRMSEKKQTFYVFGRYDYYDSMYKVAEGLSHYAYWERRCYSIGINYSPIKELVFKAEYKYRDIIDDEFNDEPTFSIGLMWAGFFKR